ncbi:conjugal transfer protein TraF [Vibrio sp. S11_S32]|uniref:conjugal transfer protein TraF n=1 Tax=Vibrio sp. S11_S32 TaxID=2720225 RepID=UPI001680E0E5|nr:conjugal transfer protein TraF [Vibrio sp. S11_S32]MBD1576959.1 conjugal transfer protein TraF [Vibrio sp. S11_S32]
MKHLMTLTVFLLTILSLNTPAFAISAVDIAAQDTQAQQDTLRNNTIQTDFTSAIINTAPVSPVLKKAPPHSKYALVYIFSSECPYCHKFTPKVSEFLRQHPNLQHYAFSIDGKGLPDFEHPMPANKEVIHHFFGTPHFVYPATFFVNTETNKFTGLTYQNVALETLESRYEQLVTSPTLLNALN